MSSEQDPAKANPSEPQFQQTALRDVTARDIQIGQIVQKIVHLGLPFNNQHLRFVQFLANAMYASLLLGGFWRLWQYGADGQTLLMLILGSVLLSLTCLYYAWFWKPDMQDKRPRRLRRLTIVACLIIPLSTGSGFFVWKALPSPHVLVLVANFANSQNADYRDDQRVTENILKNLKAVTKPYADVKVQALDQTIRVQEGSEVAHVQGEQRKAAIVIWGDYVPTKTHIQISVHFEVLKLPEFFPTLQPTASGQAQTLAIAELKSFQLQTRLSNEMSYLTLFTLGMVQYAEEDWDGAITRFGDALAQVDNTSPFLNPSVVFFYLGNAASFSGNYTQAIADFNQAIQLQPDFAEAYTNRGIAYYEQGYSTQAIADFNQAIQLQPDFADAYYNQGVAYAQQGNYTQAIADFNQAINLQPDFAEAYTNRGNAYYEQGNSTQAIADFNQTINLQPDLALAYNNRGIVYYKQGNYTQAIVDYNQAINLQPDFARAYNSRGNAYYEQGNYTQAIVDYNQAINFRPDFALAYTNRGVAYAEQGNYTQAIADYNQAIQLQPDLTLAHTNRGIAYAEQGSYTRAIADFNQAIQLQPDDAMAYTNRGIFYYEQGNYTQAITDFNQEIKLKPDYADAYGNRGISYLEQGNYTQAIADFDQAIKLQPNDVRVYYNRACVYSLQQDVKAALEDLQRAITLDARVREAAKTDANFDNVRQDKQFQTLIRQIGSAG